MAELKPPPFRDPVDQDSRLGLRASWHQWLDQLFRWLNALYTTVSGNSTSITSLNSSVSSLNSSVSSLNSDVSTLQTDNTGTNTGDQVGDGTTITGAGTILDPFVAQYLAYLANRVSNVLSAIATIAASVTPVSAGVTLGNQVAAAGTLWRITVYATFTAISSGTSRTAGVSIYWGSTLLAASALTVLASRAQTTDFKAEFLLVGVDASNIWQSGKIFQLLNTAVSSQYWKTNVLPAPSNVSVSSGAQTIDVRFEVSAVVSGETWNVGQVLIERVLP